MPESAYLSSKLAYELFLHLIVPELASVLKRFSVVLLEKVPVLHEMALLLEGCYLWHVFLESDR